MIISRHAGRELVDSGLHGIQTCTAWSAENGDGGYITRLAAGARFPSHTHQGWEQNFVISGRIRFNDIEATAGDIVQAQGADEHEAVALEDTVLFTAHSGGITFSNA